MNDELLCFMFSKMFRNFFKKLVLMNMFIFVCFELFRMGCNNVIGHSYLLGM